MNQAELKDWEENRSLKGISTRTLMGWRDRAYKCGGMYDPHDNHEGPFISIAAILAELNTREHIPNKIEAKVIRRVAARGGKKDIVTYTYRGQVERATGSSRCRPGYAWNKGYAESNEVPWRTRKECEAEAKARGVKAVFVG